MKYKVLKSLVYGGITYAEGQEVDIVEKSVAQNCLERELIAEIESTTETEEIENTGNNEDAAEEVVTSEITEERTENVSESTEKDTKSEKQVKKTKNK